MNHLVIAGNLGADPEVRFTSTGQKVTTFRIAVNNRRGGKEETFWWRVTVWGEQFDKLIAYLKKGSSVLVMGDMNKPEIYQDREGKPQISLGITAYNITFSPFGRSSSSSSTEQQSYQPSAGNQYPQQSEQSFAPSMQGQANDEALNQFSDDEIPF